jgi:hypothetical protein
MTTATLRRQYSPFGTCGILTVNGGVICQTLERNWYNNRPNVSCIPEGLYKVKPDDFRGNYSNYRLEDVAGRTFIEIHKGNKLDHTKGCLLTATKIILKDNEPFCLGSNEAFASLMKAFDNFGVKQLHIIGWRPGFGS